MTVVYIAITINHKTYTIASFDDYETECTIVLLYLNNIDLNRQYTYRELTGIRRATFRRNGIKDFSFLSSYNELVELTISHNEIGDPGVLSELSDLRVLALDMTGITDLNFLRGLGNLNRLSIHEYSVENVEALYSLPNLRILTVNKPVYKLIDKRRLRRADGTPVEVKISNHADRGLHVMSESLPRETSSIMRRNAEAMASFVTCELTDAAVKSSLVSKINSGTDRFYSDKRFSIVDYSSFGYERIDLYEDIESFAGDEYTWYVTYEGPVADNITDVDEDRIYSISIFKRDHGLKLVGMAEKSFYSVERNDPRFSEIRRKSYPANLAHVKYLLDNQIGWGELSGYAERIYIHAGTINNLISPAILVNHNVFREIEIDDDGYHYNRTVEGEKKSVKMIAYGHIEFE